MKYDLVTKLDRKVFAEELQPELPKRLFDAHVHAFDKTCFPEGFSLGEKSCYAKSEASIQRSWRRKCSRNCCRIEVSFTASAPSIPMPIVDGYSEHDNKRVFAMAVVSPRILRNC